jgi:Tfp pilus assembly protein PilE
MSKNQKGFGLIEALIIVVILGLVSGVGFYVWKLTKENSDKQLNTQTTQQTSPPPAASANSEYLAYTNSNLGYSLKYPSSWKKEEKIYKAGENSTADSEGVTFYSPEFKPKESSVFGEIQDGAVISVEVYNTTNGHKDIYEYRDADGIYGVDDLGNPNDTKDITFKGLKAVEGYDCGHPRGGLLCLVFIYNGWFYQINFESKEGEKATDSKYYTEYKKMLESFTIG